MLTSPHSLVSADVVVRFKGIDWQPIPEEIEEEEAGDIDEFTSRGGKEQNRIDHCHYRSNAPSTLIITPPPPDTVASPSFSSSTVSKNGEFTPSFNLNLTPTTHWLFSGSVPQFIPPPPARHRKTRSLTLSLTADDSSPVRSLTHASAPETSVYDAMSLAPPGSPPGLTSSKSSSVQSSSLSAADASADLAHFEDIGLDDENVRLPNRPAQQQRQGLRPIPTALGLQSQSNKNAGSKSSLSAADAGAGRNHSPAFPPMRELINGARAISPGPLSAPLKADISRGSTLSAGSPRPPLSSSSSTSLARVAMRNRSRSPSRSPSPSHFSARSPPLSAPNLGTATSPQAYGSSPGTFPPRTSSRRSSAAASVRPRKSTAELEAEFQALEDGGDDDLPEEASLWNVPLSPALYRTASSALSSGKSSAATSANTSPERRPSPSSTPRLRPRNRRSSPMLSSRGLPRNAPLSGRPFPRRSDSNLTNGPGKQRLVRAGTTGHLPNTHELGNNRTKSWDMVLGEMSEEAKVLSELLDQHATGEKAIVGNDSAGDLPTTGQQENEQKTPTSSPPLKPSIERSSTTPMPSLPPLRRNDIAIDPLPVSKEKEAVLSRTRPSWLPPKDPREEKRHLKEYQRMVAASMEAEKRRDAKAVSDRSSRDDTSATLQRIWTQHVLPDLGSALAEPRTRELWWRGIPPSVRPEAWRLGIGNELGLTPTTYQKALARARAIEERASQSTTALGAADSVRELSWFAALDSDIRRALPSLGMFQQGQPLHEALRDVLRAYACYRADVGRVPGAHLTAALLVLVLPSASEAFTALANLLNRPLPLAFLAGDAGGIRRTFTLIRQALRTKRPALEAHLFSTLRLSEADVFEPLMRTMFLGGCCEPAAPGPVSPPHQQRRRVSNGPGADAPVPAGKGLSLPLALRIWDLIVFEGDRAVIRAAVGVLGLAESRLYGTRAEVLDVLGWGGSLGLDVAPVAPATPTKGSDHAGKRDSSGSMIGGVDIGAGQWDDEVERAIDVVRAAGRAERPLDGGGRRTSA